MDEWNSQVEPVREAVAEQPRPVSLLRIGLTGIAAAALVAVAILAVMATASPSGILAAGSTGSGTPNTTVPNANGGGPGGPGGFDDRGGPGMGGVTITAISGSKISLATADGWTRTITVDSGTTYSKGSTTISLSDLKVGDEIGFRETKASDGSYSIDSINVVMPRSAGQITAISGSTITIKAKDGSTSTITVTGSTTYNVAGATAKLSDLKVDMFIVAEGTKNSDGSLTATSVDAGDHDGPGGRGFGGFGPGGPGPYGNGGAPNASAAPSSTSSTN